MNKILTILFVSVFIASAVYAQEKLSLQQAIQIGLEKNIDVITAKNRMQSQQAGVTSAFGNLLPTLSASASWSRDGSTTSTTLGDFVIATGNVGASLNANVTLFDGFRNTSSLNRANSLASSSEYDFSKRRQDVALGVLQAYLTVLRNKQLLTVNEDNLKRSQQQLSRITESNKVGAVAKADVFRQQVATGTDELSLISAQSNYDNSKLDLLYLLSLDVTKEYDFDDATVLKEVETLDSTYKNQVNDYKKLVDEALVSRPDYQSSVMSKNVAASNLTIARSGYMPTLSLGGGYGIRGVDFSTVTDTKSWNVNLSLSVPIFSGFQTSTSVQTSQLDFELADQTVDQTKRKVQKEIRTALLSLETAQKRLEVSLKSVASAEEDRRIAEERYNLGSNTLLDLLTATASYTQALSTKVNGAFDFLYAKQQFRVVVGRDKY
jgi:outer membrane protein